MTLQPQDPHKFVSDLLKIRHILSEEKRLDLLATLDVVIDVAEGKGEQHKKH
jgi:hypothetical protein